VTALAEVQTFAAIALTVSEGSAPAGQSGGVEIKDSDRCPSSSRPPRCRQSIGRHGMLQC
jgi:hypothetical protein